jgi:S-DNA-T family DNA segregation ATPase FtsK/SpoIIIE
MINFEENKKKALSVVLLIFVGFFTLISVFIPGCSGITGTYYTKNLLFPVFGHASYVFGIFLIFFSIFLFASKKPFKRISGLFLLLFPLIIFIDSFFANGALLKGSVVTEYLKSGLVLIIGTGGFYLTCIISMLVGFALIIPENYIPDNYNKIRQVIDDKIKGLKSEESVEEKKIKTKKHDNINKQPTEQPKKVANKKTPQKKQARKKLEKDRSIGVSEDNSIKNDDVKRLYFDFSSPPFEKPSMDVFDRNEIDLHTDTGGRREVIIEAFASFGVKIDIGDISKGPSVEQYEIIPQKGVKLARIKGLDEDISISLKTKVCIIINHEGVLCIEVPCSDRQNVHFKYLLETTEPNNYKIPVVLGVDSSFKTIGFDLTTLPHLLIAGTTGSGKSILVKSIIASIMYYSTPSDTKLVLIDPKRVEFGIFNQSPFLACKAITDMDDSETVLSMLVDEMELRYDILEKTSCSNINQFNKSCDENEKIPSLVIIVDEFADLMMKGKSTISDNIIRIAQKARACGIHLVLATQRPSADVINGLIKANVPGRIALSVSSGIDSKIILDRTGADKLLGKGDMLFISGKYKDGIRLQGSYISDNEILRLQNNEIEEMDDEDAIL